MQDYFYHSHRQLKRMVTTEFRFQGYCIHKYFINEKEETILYIKKMKTIADHIFSLNSTSENYVKKFIIISYLFNVITSLIRLLLLDIDNYFFKKITNNWIFLYCFKNSTFRKVSSILFVHMLTL